MCLSVRPCSPDRVPYDSLMTNLFLLLFVRLPLQIQFTTEPNPSGCRYLPCQGGRESLLQRDLYLFFPSLGAV